MSAPLGPLNDLCVVVETISAYSKGDGITLAAISPEMWAISTNNRASI